MAEIFNFLSYWKKEENELQIFEIFDLETEKKIQRYVYGDCWYKRPNHKIHYNKRPNQQKA